MLTAQVMGRDGPSGDAGQSFLASLPWRVQVAPPVVEAVAASRSTSRRGWRDFCATTTVLAVCFLRPAYQPEPEPHGG